MNCKREKWYKIREYIFLSLLFIEIILRLLERSRFNMKTPIGYKLVALELFWIPVFLGVLYLADILLTDGIRKNIKKILIDASIGLCFIVAAYASTDFFILATGAFLLTSDKSSLKNIAKVIAAALILGTLTILLLSQIGIVDDKLFNRFGRTAHSFGFRHYAFPARQFLFGWLAYVYARTKKLSWTELILHLIFIITLYYFTTQRLTFIVFIGVWALYIILVKYELININSPFIKFCSLTGFTVCGIFSIVTSYFYSPSNKLLVKLDDILNTRLQLGKEAFNRYDIKLFGQFVEDIGIDTGNYFYIDCGYLDVLFSLGIIMFIITTLIYTIMYLYSCKTEDKKLFLWITGVMIYTIVDNVWLDLIGAGTVIVLFAALMHENKKEKYNIHKKYSNSIIK